MPSSDTHHEHRPRTDFDVLAERLRARILYPGTVTAPLASLEARARLSISQAVRARRAPASAYLSLSERVGIPLTMLRPRAPHIVVAHLLTSPEKRRVAELTRYLRRADVILVFSRAQERYLRDEIGLDERRARFIWDKVDHRFFTPTGDSDVNGYVLSVGREQRDYATLVRALEPLGLKCVIVAGSTWSHRSLTPLSLPSHIELREDLSYPELRRLYQRARVVAVPIHDGTDYAAGVNGVLEGMACGRPVVASVTPGLSGYVEDGVNGREVAAADPDALRAVVAELWDDAAQARRLGNEARRTIEAGRTIEHFVRRISAVIDEFA